MATKRHEITVDTLLVDLEEDRALARSEGQGAAAVGATMAKARLLGFIVDRKESGQPGEFANLQSIQDVISLVRQELGDVAAQALAKLATAATVDQAVDQAPNPTHEPSGSIN